MHDFAYLRPTSVAEGVRALRAVDDGRFLAGGMTLIPTMRQRLASPTCLIDLSGIEGLDAIRVEDRIWWSERWRGTTPSRLRR